MKEVLEGSSVLAIRQGGVVHFLNPVYLKNYLSCLP
jgi:hypothetical protein